jgi:RimJ/RimL family protein N-acetyltransferase
VLIGDLVVLRARAEADVAVLHAELHDDVPTRSRADRRAWTPVGPAHSPYAVRPGSDTAAEFSVVERATGELAGEAVLWGIDRHHRSAHVGLSLRPSFRGRGLGGDVVRALTRYGFATLGLHRLQLETLADNAAMIAAAARAGYRREGQLRRSAWVDGTFADEVVMAALADEWG